ncbi:MAG: indolepyruvate ferredoxin oxidoreductase subunit alpha [Sulfolobales archaeon]
MYRVSLLLGNEAIALGALEAGIGVATAYPGTPSSEIIGTIERYARELGVYVEWSVNEKVAFEIAWAAALSGVRSLTAMKHVGLNVASDALMSSAYTGVSEGFVIVSADDPSMWSSQNEQDNRLYGLISYIPVFEPENPWEAKELTKKLYDISSETKHPVILRTTTRVSHTRGPVRLGELRKTRVKGSFKPEPRYVLVPSNARINRIDLLKRWNNIKTMIENLEFNKVFGDGRIAIVSPSTAFSYVYEAIYKADLIDKVKLIKLSSVYPLPEKFLINNLSDAEKIVVIEELEPLVEMQLRDILSRNDIRIPLLSKPYEYRVFELTVDRVREILEKTLGVALRKEVFTRGIEGEIKLPPRPPVFCAGCPYRPLFFELKRILAKERIKAVISGDIGCYSLAYYDPFNMQHTIVEMGGSIGLGNGFSTVLEDTITISVIGDSTFFHAGIPALINSVYNRHPQIIIVLDNMVTAMTGHQPSPSTPRGDRYVKIERLAESIGVKYVAVVDPFNTDEFRKSFLEALKVVREEREVAVIVARRKCALEAYWSMLRDGIEIVPYTVDPSKCLGCGICYNLFACPAIFAGENKKAYIDPELCIGCGSCVISCPFNAIKPLKPVDQEALKKYWF